MKKVLVDFKFKNSRYALLANKIKEAIKGTAFEGKIYLKGDAIRDQLIGIERDDYELPFVIVVATPNGGISFASWIVYKNSCMVGGQNPSINIQKGTAKFKLNSDPDIGDITLAARQSKKYNCVNETRTALSIHGTIEDDAEKSGFTVDALYYNVTTGELNDFTGYAFDDIEKGIIRATDINCVFSEDPTNILSAIRCSSELGFGIEKETWFKMIAGKAKLLGLNASTVRDQINKILLSPKPSIGIRKLLYSGCLPLTLPYIYVLNTIYMGPRTSVTVFDHTMKVLDATPATLVTRLGALLHDVGKGTTVNNGYMYHQMVGIERAKTMLETMGYSDDIVKSVSKIVEYHDDLRKFTGNQIPGYRYIKRFIEKCGDDIENVLDVIDANNKAQEFGKKPRQVMEFRKAMVKAKEKMAATKERMDAMKSKLPIDGNDIMKEFKMKPSQLVGHLLDAVKEEFKKDPTMTKDDCLSVCESTLRKIY